MSLSAEPSHCLDDDNGRTLDGNRIQAWDRNMINGGDAQKFEIRADGTIRVAGKCIDPPTPAPPTARSSVALPLQRQLGQQFRPHAGGTIYHPESGPAAWTPAT
ncbi:ricin-type beta-trefoil lectin domain protein [Streptomyces sp. NPDC051109]|uniref:ricin-type beta-trefoil lectin domain protein n=1 Tax=Streptomyces sp. NPDC051109 TaxID=3365642 RepID=UPI00379071ED